MEQNIFNLNNKIYSNNNNILFEIVNDLHQLMNYSKDNLILKSLGNIINKVNYIIKENKKNLELIRNDILSLHKRFDELKTNNLNNQVLYLENGKYIGQIVNGLAEGRGIQYGTKEPFIGDRYEGEWKNNKKEGKGIYYWNNGDKYDGDWRNGKFEGKGIYYYNNGDRYEGDWRNDKFEGKGIYYFNNGNREMGDYLNNKKIGKHVTLTSNGEVIKIDIYILLNNLKINE